MERKIKLIPYRVYKYCPKCTGTMEACKFGVLTTNGTGSNSIVLNSIITTNPPFTVSSMAMSSYNHRCNKCGHGENYDKNYPYIDYIEDGNMG